MKIHKKASNLKRVREVGFGETFWFAGKVYQRIQFPEDFDNEEQEITLISRLSDGFTMTLHLNIYVSPAETSLIVETPCAN